MGAAAAVVQEVLGSLLLPQQDFRHSQQGAAAGVEVGAVGNDVNDVDDDVVSPRHLHSQRVTVTSEGSLTSAKEETHIKTRNTYPYLTLHSTGDSHTTYAVSSIFFNITYVQIFSLQFLNSIRSTFITSNSLSQLSLLDFAHFISIQHAPVITL